MNFYHKTCGNGHVNLGLNFNQFHFLPITIALKFILLFCLPSQLDFLEDDLKLVNKEHVHGRNQLVLCSREYGQQSFRLPPSSPYDKFMKAAGC